MKCPSGHLQRVPVHALRPCITLAENSQAFQAVIGGQKREKPDFVHHSYLLRFKSWLLILQKADLNQQPLTVSCPRKVVGHGLDSVQCFLAVHPLILQ